MNLKLDWINGVTNKKGQHIFLCGLMGAGKSTVGKELSYRLNRAFVDLDEQIELTSEQSIQEIFSEYGEEKFRSIESEALEQIMKRDESFVCALGGGSLVKEKNTILLQSHSLIYLQASAVFLAQRLNEDQSRPLLQNCDREEKLDLLLKERKSSYENADLHVNVEGQSIEVIVQSILNWIHNENS